jgi:hypothetical protein
MVIDPRMYEKHSGRKGDPMTRMGEVLAKDAKHKQERDEMPKGVSGGMKVIRQHGIVAQIYYWFKNRARGK